MLAPGRGACHDADDGSGTAYRKAESATDRSQSARWKLDTAKRIGKEMKGLPLEYYEDPVSWPG